MSGADRRRLNWHGLTWHGLFVAGVVVKGLDGVLELLGGVGLLVTGREVVHRWVLALAEWEFDVGRHDMAGGLLVSLAQHLTSNTQQFVAMYLVGHGVVKVFLVVGMLRRWMWAYPTATMVLCGFAGYQAYRIGEHFSVGLVIFTLVDLFVVWLVVGEYRRLKRERGKQ